MIDLGESQVFEGKMANLLQRRFGGVLSRGNLFQELAQPVRSHRSDYGSFRNDLHRVGSWRNVDG
jgi:hypothetical protein